MEVPPTDEIIRRIQSHKGVQGVVVTTSDGTPIRSTMDNTSTAVYLRGVSHLYGIASSMIRDVDPNDFLEFMRVRTRRYELILNVGEGYMALVIQNPNEN